MCADDLLLLLAWRVVDATQLQRTTWASNHTTVSRRIAALERNLEGKLLTRAPYGWEPTELGSRAIAAAEKFKPSLAG